MLVWTDLARLFVGTVLLAFAAWTDWRWRRAPNVLWLVMAGAGLLLLAVDAATRFAEVRAAWPYLVVALVLPVVYYALYVVGLIAGGADAKALMALAILVPFPLRLGPDVPLFASPMPQSVVVFVDSLLAFMLVPVAILLLNLARGDVSPAAFVGVRKPLDDVGKSHDWLMERVDDDGRVRRRWFASRGSYDLEEEKEKLRARGVARVWVTPKVPFMIPLTAGFVASYVVGDVLSAATRAVLG